MVEWLILVCGAVGLDDPVRPPKGALSHQGKA